LYGSSDSCEVAGFVKSVRLVLEFVDQAEASATISCTSRRWQTQFMGPFASASSTGGLSSSFCRSTISAASLRSRHMQFRIASPFKLTAVPERETSDTRSNADSSKEACIGNAPASPHPRLLPIPRSKASSKRWTYLSIRTCRYAAVRRCPLTCLPCGPYPRQPIASRESQACRRRSVRCIVCVQGAYRRSPA
jgi:hypothetical protein